MTKPVSRVGVVATVAAAMLAAVFATAGPAGALDVYVVTDDGDSGPGTLREALDLADSDGDDALITFAPGISTIELETGLVYSLEAGVTISGEVTITPSATWSGGGDALLAFDNSTEGIGEVTLEGVAVTGGPGDGIAVYADCADVDLTVDGIVASDNAAHGLVMQQYECETDISVVVRHSSFTGNGEDGLDLDHDYDDHDVFDVDVSHSLFADNGERGLFVYHRYEADVFVDIAHSDFRGNGDDGALVWTEDGTTSDEVRVTVIHSDFVDNGDEDPTGDDPDDELFEHGLEVDAEDVDLDVSITSSVFSGNYREGLESDQYDDGDVTVSITSSTFRTNGDDGMQIDESGDGDLDLSITASAATDNGTRISSAEGLDADEDESGDFDLRLTNTRMNDNPDDGMTLDENGSGDLTITTLNSHFDGNGEDGIDAEEDADDDEGGSLTLRHFLSTTNDNGNGSSNGDEGIDIDEYGTGTVTALIFQSESTGNFGGSGLDVFSDGSGFVLLLLSDFLGNGDSAWRVDPGVFVLPIATPGG